MALTSIEHAHLEARANEIVRRLNYDPESPWFKQIKEMDKSKGLISQRVFVDKLKPLLNEQKRGLLHIYTEEEQYGILKNYFDAIKLTFPHFWGNSLLTKELGFKAMISLFPTVIQLCLSTYKDFKTTSIRKILEPMKDYDFRHKDHLKRKDAVSTGRIISSLNSYLKDIKSTSKIKL